MAEVELGFPRTYVEFVNPEDESEVFRCDLTWLTSRWTCLFGAGCPGIYDSNPDAGCCALGAHFCDDADADRVEAVMEQLTPAQWEGHDEAHRNGWAERDADGELKTRSVGGACIFHNSRDFPGGYGCALHGYAVAEGIKPHLTKPDVCWQLPLRRQFREVDPGDGRTYTEVQIGEYTRAGWGPGGADLDWYCSSNTEAHIGTEPVYLANVDELTALMGKRGYAELVRHCERFDAAAERTPHLADPEHAPPAPA